MIDTSFRAWLPRCTGPLLRVYRALGLSPNGVTFLGLAFALASAVGVACGAGIGAILFWWLGRLFDGTDGIYARATGRVTDLGGYLDILVDMAAYGSVIVGFYFARTELAGYWLAVMFLYVLCITSALALGGLLKGRELSKDNRSLTLAAGLAEGGETGIAYTLFLLFPDWLPELVSIWIVVLAVTVGARTLLARRVLR